MAMMGDRFGQILKYAPVRTRLAARAGESKMRALHALANRAAFRGRGAAVQRLAWLVDAICWPLACAILCRRGDEKLDRAVEATGLSRSAYLMRQWRACVRLKIPPNEYLHFAFHEPERLAKAGEYLLDIENYRLIGWLNEGVDIAPLQDKAAFAEVCERHGLPTPPVLAVFSRGRTDLRIDPASNAWRGGLFIKPRAAKAGAGMHRFAYEGGDTWRASRGEAVRLADILAAAARASETGDLVIQPLITNDEATARLTTGALSTVRIMTGRFADGWTAPVGAFLRMGRGEAIVDNISAGGLMATVDLSTGRLSAANRRWDPYRLLDTHPDTGAAITGGTVPQWRAMLDLALRGHAAFADFAFVSWDIAPTPDGPVIIEANHHGGTVAFQELNGAPLAQSPFAEVCLSRLAAGR